MAIINSAAWTGLPTQVTQSDIWMDNVANGVLTTAGSVFGIVQGVGINNQAMPIPAMTLIDMIRMRLHVTSYDPPLFQFMECFHGSDDRVHVFVVQNNEPFTLTDTWGLFPSDTLITQLRLLLDSK